jgi:hypothetical protein
MKKILRTLVFISFSTLMGTTLYAANPASQEWVLQQIAANQTLLTASDWEAACTSGSPSSSTGCYGNANSAAFTKISNSLGGFTRYANINPVNAPNSIFIKSFFAGTNIPAQPVNLNVTVTGAARCALFTQVGQGLGLGGVSTSNPPSGQATPYYVILHTVSFFTINNATNNSSTDGVMYNNEDAGGTSQPMSSVVIPNPIYFLCAGFNPSDGSTASTIVVYAT